MFLDPQVYLFELLLSGQLPRDQKVQHLATVCLRTGEEEFPCVPIGVRQPLTYHLQSLAKCEELLCGLGGLEGLVAKQPGGFPQSGCLPTETGMCHVFRVKVKSRQYVTRHYGLYRFEECTSSANRVREGFRLLTTREEREFEWFLSEESKATLSRLRAAVCAYSQSVALDLQDLPGAEWPKRIAEKHCGWAAGEGGSVKGLEKALGLLVLRFQEGFRRNGSILPCGVVRSAVLEITPSQLPKLLPRLMEQLVAAVM